MDSTNFDVAALEQRFRVELAASDTREGLVELRRQYLGKDSAIREALRNLRQVDAQSRAQVAARINGLSAAIQEVSSGTGGRRAVAFCRAGPRPAQSIN